jgi:hypothetical protein
MALVVLITAILISALVVKVGTVALTMTGMDRRKAAFQSQPAGANTGWTTRETELIMAHDQRRRIVGAIMAPGYGGFASVIATITASLSQHGVIGLFRSLAVLAVDRTYQIIPAPDAETLLLPGDRLICYCKVKSPAGHYM